MGKCQIVTILWDKERRPLVYYCLTHHEHFSPTDGMPVCPYSVNWDIQNSGPNVSCVDDAATTVLLTSKTMVVRDGECDIVNRMETLKTWLARVLARLAEWLSPERL